MKGFFDSLTLKSLHIFRILFGIFLVFLLAFLIAQIYDDAITIKEEVATDFSEQVRTLDLKLIEIEQELKRASRLTEIELNLPKQNILDNFSLDNNESSNYTLLNPKKWKITSYENINTMTKIQLKTLSSLISTGHYIPLHLDLNKYQAIALTINDPKTTLVYPSFFEENLFTALNQLSNDNKTNIVDALNQLIIKDSIKLQSKDEYWILPHKSLFNNIDAIGLAVPIFSRDNRKEIGYTYTDIAVDLFYQYLEIMQNIEANIMLTMNDGEKNHIVNSSFPLKLNNSAKQLYLTRELEQQIPRELTELLNQSSGWVIHDQDGYFLISVPLTNPLFRITFFTHSNNFYLANKNKSISKVYIFVFVVFFGVLLDIVIRRKFLQPLLISNQNLTQEREHLKDTHFELKKIQNILLESEKLALLGQFVASISDEIISPLKKAITASTIERASITKLLNSKESQQLTPNQIRRSINDISNAHDQIHNNLENALELCESLKQISADKSSSNLKTINIGKYIEKTLKSITPEMKKRKVLVFFSYDQDYLVTTYSSAINQVLINLIFNAALHAYDKNIGGEIYIKVFEQDENIGISVTDFGKGIDEKTQEKMFTPFYTTKESKRGTGVGLNICKSLVEITLKGTLKLQTSLGQGSCFTVLIPKNISLS